MEMVGYWKRAESCEAKLIKNDGVTVMQMEGEKYQFPGFPRGYLLYGMLSKIKHEIKNQIFNDSWAKLEEGKTRNEVVRDIKNVLPNIYKIGDSMKYEMLPPETLVPAVREIHRAWTKVHPQSSKLRDILCLILHEDDSYRFRFQWIVTYFRPRWWVKIIPTLEKALVMLEHAEVIGDMKERIRLFRRVLLVFIEHTSVKKHFLALCKEIDWDKVKLSKADKYFFRGKYFKVDMDLFEY